MSTPDSTALRDPERAHDERRDFAAAHRLPGIAAIAAGVGVLSTFAAWALLHLIRLFTNLFFFQVLSDRPVSPAANTLGLAVIAVPAIGGLVIGLMARYGSEKIRGHGIPEAIEAILFNKSRMSPKVAILKPISSGIAIGSGGPFGAEGPIIMTGGALGSLVGQFFRITAGERKTLLVAGAVAGMTAVFGTPIAAVMLAVELLLFELRPRSLLPVAIACCVAAAVRPLLLDGGALFPLQTHTPSLMTLASCVIAGLAAGALSWTVSTSLYKVEDLFGRLPIHWMWWPALGGLAVGIGGYLEPRALGVGYDVIGDLLANRLALDVVLALILCKAAMWVIALGSGTSGGVLAPLLMMGASLGVLMGPWLPGGQPALWPLVFMAATLGGMMRAPVMSVMFALELTHDVDAMLPLLISSAVAYGFTVATMPRSILTEKISRRGHHIYREYGIDPLERHIVAEVMTREVETLDGESTIAGALERHFGGTQRHRAYPVLVGGRFIGMVDRDVTDAQSRRLVGLVARSDLMVDAIAWILLAFVVALAGSGDGLVGAARTGAGVAALLGFVFLVLKPAFGWLLRTHAPDGQPSATVLAALMIGLLGCAMLTEWMHLHAVFGAFLFGAGLPRDDRLLASLVHRVEPIAMVVLMPLFFALAGLSTTGGAFTSAGWGAFALVTAAAAVGKIAGAAAGARATGFGWRDSLATGALMNARGLMELIVMKIGLDAGLIGREMFTILLLMALVTTAMTTPLIGLVVGRRVAARDDGETIEPAAP